MIGLKTKKSLRFSHLCTITGILVFLIGTVDTEAQLPFKDTNLPIDARVTDLLSRMTPGEKFSQLGNQAPAISRLGIKAYNYWNEAIDVPETQDYLITYRIAGQEDGKIILQSISGNIATGLATTTFKATDGIFVLNISNISQSVNKRFIVHK